MGTYPAIMYATLKLLHISSAILTISGFVLRGIWSIRDSDVLQKPLVRVLPHVIDTVFLLSGIGLILQLHLQVLQHDWLLIKLAVLVLYVAFGMVALRHSLSIGLRSTAFAAALLSFAYIAGVAVNKSAHSWLAVS